jgi:hypothetical protein
VIWKRYNTVATGQIVFIESTAQGQEGHYFELCENAQAAQRMEAQLTPLDYRFHFFPWYREPEYALAPEGVVIPAGYSEYFHKLEATAGIKLSPAQQAWYYKKALVQLGDMKREYPSTPQEAFEGAVDGAYYAEQMAKAELDGRIGNHKAIADLPINTSWDIGVGDSTAIWFWQQQPGQICLVGYYENSGEGFPFYVRVLRDYATRLGWKYGEHLVPHDARVKEWGSGRTRIEELVEALDGVRLVTRSAVADGINACRAAADLLFRRGGMRGRNQAPQVLPQGLGRGARVLAGQAAPRLGKPWCRRLPRPRHVLAQGRRRAPQG